MSTKEPRPYWSVVRLIYQSDEGPREWSTTIAFIARGMLDAVRAARRFGEDRARNLNTPEYRNHVLSGVTVGDFTPGYIDEHGGYQDPKGVVFFEWEISRSDTTLENEIARLARRT